ncbi:hypothetical protein OJ253_3400 [Cryptosporidium canis]|uniref:Uncharacterized protein n=1 Tax=Cryptosporidium canis TaxID=195482 RepID=A0A9D5DG12_9CRYT|nr:hypothetical protein OJ253_3400 [Cryptosporidium canis]
MGCCVTKDVSTLGNDKLEKKSHGLSLSHGMIPSSQFTGRVSSLKEMMYTEHINNKNICHTSSMEFIQPQIKELHAIWITSILKKLRSEIDTIFLLSRLIEIMELLDPSDGNSIVRSHMCESGAVEIISNTIKHHKGSPEIVLICIFLLTHLFFNDGISEQMVPLIIPDILDLFTNLEMMHWDSSENNSILMAIFRLIFISSSDSQRVCEIWIESDVGRKIVLYLKDESIDERTQIWGFAALRFLVRSSLSACEEFLKLGVFELATPKLDKNQDLFLIESILALYVAILSTSKDFKLNNPNIIKEILEIVAGNINNGQIVQYGLVILVMSCQRTEVYSHIISAYGAKKLIQSIIRTYRKDSAYIQIIHLSKLLIECLCSYCSKTTSIKLVNNRLVFSHQFDPGRFAASDSAWMMVEVGKEIHTLIKP